MNKVTQLVTVAIVTLTPAVAVAGAPGSISGAAAVQLLPSGQVNFEIQDESEDFDLETAYGLAVQLDYWASEQLTIGIAPRYILNIIPEDEDDDDAASQLDLAVRVALHHAVNPQLGIYGFAAPGYSIIMLPEDAEDIDNPAGLILGFGAGMRYALNPKTFFQGELGYQLGFQGLEEQGVDIEFSTNLIHLGIGIGSQF